MVIPPSRFIARYLSSMRCTQSDEEGVWVRAGGGKGSLTQQAAPLCSPCWRGSLLHLSHSSGKKKPCQPFLITRKRPISKMPADFHILPPSSLKHDVISPLQYNKYFTFKSRFIKRSPGGRNNKVSLYSPNKTAKDIFYNLYF